MLGLAPFDGQVAFFFGGSVIEKPFPELGSISEFKNIVTHGSIISETPAHVNEQRKTPMNVGENQRVGAVCRTRTDTLLRAADFESTASTDFAKTARG